jgi:adenosylhomocysteine nucleosidase
VPASLAGPDGESPEVSADHHRLAAALAPWAATGCLVTSRAVVPTPRDKAALFARTGAVAVDLESSLIAAAAAEAGLPAIAVRGVSDAAHQSLPVELAGLVTAEGRLRMAGAAALLARPRVVPLALELRRATREALRAVAAVLAGLTAAPAAH